ncbi:MAG: replication-relaxation family protein [Actinomycetes bacterium]
MGGSAPWHGVLDTLGLEIVAADRGIEVFRPAAKHARALALADSQRLAHLVGVNGVFRSLARWARSQDDAELAEWWPERRCVSEWGQVVRPDGFGVIRRGDRAIEFSVECNAGTETLGRLAARLDGYADLVRATGWSPWVAFYFPSPHRIHPSLALPPGS